jgi:hypothetical protein
LHLGLLAWRGQWAARVQCLLALHHLPLHLTLLLPLHHLRLILTLHLPLHLALHQLLLTLTLHLALHHLRLILTLHLPLHLALHQLLLGLHLALHYLPLPRAVSLALHHLQHLLLGILVPGCPNLCLRRAAHPCGQDGVGAVLSIGGRHPLGPWAVRGAPLVGEHELRRHPVKQPCRGQHSACLRVPVLSRRMPGQSRSRSERLTCGGVQQHRLLLGTGRSIHPGGVVGQGHLQAAAAQL